MVSNIEEGVGLIRWWRDKLEGNEDWNSLPKASREKLLINLQRGVSALTSIHVTKKELLHLIQLTDVPTVFEACISMAALPDLDSKDKHQALAYLTRIVLNSELGKFKKEPTWHREPPKRKRNGEIASLEYAQKYNPYNFKRFKCKVCGARIRSDNVTGVCTKCQHNGVKDGREIEH